MTRPAKVVIRLSALRHNFNRVRELAPGSKIITVVKADAYGHGLVRVATTLEDSDAYGVACIEEAIELRDAGIHKPVILMEGPFTEEELVLVERMSLDIVIHHADQISMLERTSLKRPVNAWLKIDSGMHRLGFEPGQVKRALSALRDTGSIREPIALMTHLADASDLTSVMTNRQLENFNECCSGIDGPRSIANSAGIVAWPESHADYVRPGLMLYGISPMEDSIASDYKLKPVMSLQSRLISIKRVGKGAPVGYGAEWHCPEDMSIGIVAAGYGDGYPRHAGSGTPVIVNGIATQVTGNPSMDMIAVDLRKIPDARVGDPVELWGESQPVEVVADHAGTIPYELVTGVHKRLQVVIDE